MTAKVYDVMAVEVNVVDGKRSVVKIIVPKEVIIAECSNKARDYVLLNYSDKIKAVKEVDVLVRPFQSTV